MESKFAERFNKLRKEGGDSYILRGNNIIVEIPVEEEVAAIKGSTIIMAADKNQVRQGMDETRGLLGIVIEVGEGYYDEEAGQTIGLDVEPGDVILLPKYSVSYFSVFPGIDEFVGNALGLCLETDIRMIYKNYNKARELLNE